MGKVAREVAEAEIGKWLDYKKISDSRRESNKDSIESLVVAVMSGTLVLNDDMNLEYSLNFPIGEEQKIDKLIFKPRLKVGTVHKHLQGVKATDADGRILAYVAALTSTAKAVVEAIDTEDYAVCTSVAIFFL